MSTCVTPFGVSSREKASRAMLSMTGPGMLQVRGVGGQLAEGVTKSNLEVQSDPSPADDVHAAHDGGDSGTSWEESDRGFPMEAWWIWASHGALPEMAIFCLAIRA
mmetsp:Transcript_59946/g.104882  ORF Transcript_59946/g.104882 Transcript_59946/m.104882 type:complete len:106 (-) Transcript_59946:72-389(-)